MMKEKWKDIKNYEDIYQISNYGNVKSLSRKIIHKNGDIHWVNERILKPISVGNYKGVQLSKNNKTEKRYIHRLVAENFISNPLNKETVNHINGNKNDNNVKNLEWLTQKENNHHARETKLIKMDGMNNPMYKFDDSLVLRIRKMKESGEFSQAEIARQTNVSPMQVSRIVRGLLRKEVTNG